jgi:ATP-dependent Clp protease ATP-binding subunit ClpA
VRLLRRLPRARTIRPAEPYLAAGAGEARRLGHSYVGTEHVLSALVGRSDSGAVSVLARLGVSGEAVEAELACWLPPVQARQKLDAEALAVLGIDLDAVRERLEQTFGPNALERSPFSCLGVCPRLKRALAHALDQAAGEELDDRHVLLGLLSVDDSVAARVLGHLGITHAAVEQMREESS